jgi:muramidase (phage lysozyme)
MTKNRASFLTMIALSEGTAQIGDQKGYNVIVGSTKEHPHLFIDYSKHPGVLVDLGNGLESTASGRYQILERYYDAYKKSLKLPDFSANSQDIIALQMLSECNCLHLIDEGKITEAIKLAASRWASLPGAHYDQRTNLISTLLAWYEQAGDIA